MGILHNHHQQEILPDPNTLSSQHSLSSVSSLTSKQPPPTTEPCHHLTTFRSHTSSLSSLALAANHLLSGSSDHQIRAWPRLPSPPSHSPPNLFAFGDSPVKSMLVSGDKLFTGHQDCKICVWKIGYDVDGRRNFVKSTHVATLPTVNDRLTKMFSAKSWKNHVDAVAALAVSHDGCYLYSGSWDRSFKVWRTSDFKCLDSIANAHDDAINAIVVSRDGHVYTGSSDRKIKVWKKHAGDKTHTLVDVLQKHKSGVNALALSTDESVLYSGACDRSMLVWEREDGGGDGRRHMVVAGALRGHSMGILCVVVVGDLVASGSADKTVRVWRKGIDGNRHSRVGVLEGHNGPIKCLAAAVESCTLEEGSCTSYLVYSGSLDCDVKVWRVEVPFL